MRDTGHNTKREPGGQGDDGRGVGVDLPGNASCRDRKGTPIGLFKSRPPVCDKMIVGVTFGVKIWYNRECSAQLRDGKQSGDVWQNIFCLQFFLFFFH